MVFFNIVRHHVIFIFNTKRPISRFFECCKRVWKFEWSAIILKPFTLKCMCTLQTSALPIAAPIRLFRVNLQTVRIPHDFTTLAAHTRASCGLVPEIQPHVDYIHTYIHMSCGHAQYSFFISFRNTRRGLLPPTYNIKCLECRQWCYFGMRHLLLSTWSQINGVKAPSHLAVEFRVSVG